MATVIHDNKPERTEVVREYRDTEGSGLGTILGVILALVVLALLLFYGLPLLRGANDTNVPNRIDVNLNGNVPTPGTAQ